ncbi:thiopeptide-type bacteriocin biosynthesis domain protein [Enterococcus faecalis 02-MB-P-10]|uniref:lantibiotic dehydratase C-terminal domain-containing protein n=1 Tax=Enterococcus faecalis TaxID=1351 RepID=UPI000352DB7A|nr:lantibiotic dehydratase C-terminal domain-containing protein [Enterococcus faecalis]EPH68649.1 thiopeptide-type bacteriocin biosynthesis domain protein [Enterococcus faecalis 02-MB-P-10]
MSKLNKDFLVRIPILPLKINYMIRKEWDITVIKDYIKSQYYNSCELSFKYLGLTECTSIEKLENYVSRASYRTTSFGGLIDYIYFTQGNYEVQSEDTHLREKVKAKKYELNKDTPVKKNPFYECYGELLIFIGPDNIVKIEGENLDKLTNFIEEQKKLQVQDIITFFETEYCYTTEYAKECLYSLFEQNFFLNSTLNSSHLKYQIDKNDSWIIPAKKVDNFTNNTFLSSTDLVGLNKFLSKIMECFKICNLDECLEYFYDRYSNGPIILEQLVKDKEFLNKLDKVAITIDFKNDLLVKVKKAISLAVLNGDKEVFIDINSISNKISSGPPVDIFSNLLEIYGKKYFNVDTGKYIVNEGDAQEFWENKKGKVLKYYFEDETLNQIMNFKKSGLSTNYNSSYVLDLKKLFVKVENDRFFTINEYGVEVLYTKGTLINDLYYPKSFLSILKLSSLNNIPKPLNKLIQGLYCFYSPRVTIGNVILIREQWSIYKLIQDLQTYETFEKHFRKLTTQYKIPGMVSLCYSDIESLISIENKKDLNFLYKLLKQKEEVILKEDIQKNSPVFKGNDRYANELILHSSSQNASTVKYIVRDIEVPDVSRNTIEIRLLYDSELVEKKMIFRLIEKMLMGDPFIFVNYENKGHNEMRVRIPKPEYFIDFNSIYSGSNGLVHACMVEYFPEIIRYRKMTISYFENISYMDSTIIKNILMDINSDTETLCLAVASVYSWLTIFKESGLENRIDFLNKHWFSKIDGSLYKNYNKKDELYEIDKKKVIQYIKELENSRRSICNEIIPEENMMDLVHMSTNRINGVDLVLEHNVYKRVRTGIYIKEWDT